MRHIDEHPDQRNDDWCHYCEVMFGQPMLPTREHLPPKVFLDRPYPDNLWTVSACQSCNNRSGSSEVRLAIALEVFVSGSVNPADFRRARVRELLARDDATAAACGGGCCGRAIAP